MQAAPAAVVVGEPTVKLHDATDSDFPQCIVRKNQLRSRSAAQAGDAVAKRLLCGVQTRNGQRAALVLAGVRCQLAPASSSTSAAPRPMRRRTNSLESWGRPRPKWL